LEGKMGSNRGCRRGRPRAITGKEGGMERRETTPRDVKGNGVLNQKTIFPEEKSGGGCVIEEGEKQTRDA